ncbi:hypothetical protein [Oscillibacter sp.]|uniref:hypothetical protein n=1 Tax=Oscillibacter sp. TaxID=1945593 RepID=UPI00339A60FE
MKETLKKNWKGITATVVAFGAVFGAIYYVNNVYLPDKRQAAVEQLAADEAAESVTPKEYNFDINTTQPTALSSGTDTNPADDSIKVTTDADGTVTIDRTWDAEPGELDTSTAAPNAPTANIGSGGGKITGTDGAYHGEQPAATTPSTSGATTKPSTDTSDNTTTKPSDSSTKPSTPSKPSSDTPQVGDTRTENGQKQVYVDGFGWVMDASGGASDYIEMGPDTGNYVGEMG